MSYGGDGAMVREQERQVQGCGSEAQREAL